MTAGRKPLPNNVHILNGNPSKKTQKELDEPTLDDDLDATMPEPPTEVLEEPEALKEWHRIVPQLHALGVVKNIDQTALSAYCCAYNEWIIANRALRKGRILRKKDGGLQINPCFRISKEAMEQMVRFLAEFGLTPSARVRLKGAGKKKKHNSLDEEMFG